ncbi:MAG: hypothetical protein HOP02_00800 [Methylococcaceae bacterium]|nr:hypothetical protein [Methylococcaceae bacterium]
MPAQADNDHEKEREDKSGYTIALWGDLPYSAAQAAAIPNVIADMNSQQVAFSVHDGDLKAGSSECTDAVYTTALGYFNALEAPAMFTPGDNDWTDCDRTPGYNSLVQLQKERQLLFSTPFSLGQHRLKQEVQAAPYVENRRWNVNGVIYATLNIQGSCNNLCDVFPDTVEYAARNAANIAWLKETFAQATKYHAAAVMLISQADVGWDAADPTRAPLRDAKTLAETDAQPDGFKDFLLTLRSEVTAFRKPVAYVHGDSHYFRVDKPFQDATGKRLENFTRIETFGDNQANGTNDVHWLKVFVDPNSREVFAYQPQIVPTNRVAVPAP